MHALLATAANNQLGGVSAAFIAGVVIVVALVILVVLAFMCIINWLVVGAGRAAAPEHRTINPAMFWLMLIPLFNIFWAFKIMPAISDSLNATLGDKGVTSGDCGRGVGLFFAWCVVGHWIFLVLSEVTQSELLGVVNGIFALCSFALLITYTVQVRASRKRILAI